MAENIGAMSMAQLQSQMAEAQANERWDQLTKLAAQAAKLKQAELQAEHEAKLKALANVNAKLAKAIHKLVDSMADELDEADGLWISWEFGDAEPSVSTLKAQAISPKRQASASSSKRFHITNDELVKRGEEAGHITSEYAKLGLTYRELLASHEAIAAQLGRDKKNVLYSGVRKPLIEKLGLTPDA